MPVASQYWIVLPQILKTAYLSLGDLLIIFPAQLSIYENPEVIKMGYNPGNDLQPFINDFVYPSVILLT